MGNSMGRCSDGPMTKGDSQMDCWDIDVWNAIACRLSSKQPTDPSDGQSAPKHIIVSNHKLLQSVIITPVY